MRRRLKRWMLEFLIVCFALTIASLSASAPALAQGGKVTTVRLADQPGAEVDYAAVWIAEILGYYEKEGIKIDRRTYPNGPAGLLDFDRAVVFHALAYDAAGRTLVEVGGKVPDGVVVGLKALRQVLGLRRVLLRLGGNQGAHDTGSH